MIEVDRVKQKPYLLALDLDGVVHSYDQGWHDGTLYGDPIPGAKEAIQKILDSGWEICLYTARYKRVGEYGYTPTSEEKIMEWWNKHKLPKIPLWKGDGKPLAHIYLDDRAVGFINWEQALTDVLNYPDAPSMILPREAVPTEQVALEGVKALLSLRSLEWHSDELKDTPARVVKAFKEMTEGYEQDPKEILSKQFEQEGFSYDEMVLLKDISFSSLCAHHLLPFTGKASVAYVPGEKVVGLSKLARLVHCFAKRLQVQERLTMQIAESLMEHLECPGAGVIITASHGCMSCRGVKDAGAEMVTSAMLGIFREPATRYEFLHLAK